REKLHKIEEATGVKPALIYVMFVPPRIASDQRQGVPLQVENPNAESRNPEDQLELVLVSSEGSPIRIRVPGTTRKQVLKVTQEFRGEVTNVRSGRGYIAPGKQLYQWLVAPLEPELKARGIQNPAFIMDTHLRSIPIAALYDGQQFLIEKYSIGLMPSISLTDTRYQDIKNMQVLAMGSAKFTELKPLPAVPVELSAITPTLWRGKSFLNDAFTLENLKAQRQQRPFGIIHLATHATFQPGEVSNSYIQLWNSKLRLNQLSQLGWNKPPVELLVLSACRTALGNEDAELGFAGLAVQAGVKSALGSLWFVSDEGTLGLMSEFYQQLKTAPIKAEALRQAQLAMLKGRVHLEGGKLVTDKESVPLPPELAKLKDKNFEHPYFWAAFTMVGSPW
ncbi:MAG: CHAT domain-containing protein, partial [Coleofasciculus sp. C3-bin4]|nr:CHAT domain-containing protein [Coleofasciculus sp. C3-bin4]